MHADAAANPSQPVWSELYPDHLAKQLAQIEAALPLSGCERLLIFSGAAKTLFRDDHDYPFHANPYFRRLLPLPFLADSAVLIEPGSKPKLFYPNPSDFWHQSAGRPEGFWVDSFEIVEIERAEQIGKALTDPASIAFVGEETALATDWGINHCNPEPLLHALDWASSIKTDYELASLRQASQIAARGHLAAREAFLEGYSEFGINLAYLAATGQRECELPYGNIVALNENAAVLHYQHQQRMAPEKIHSFLLDAGAQVNGYASDITRTWAYPAGSAGSVAFNALLKQMEQLQQQLCEQSLAGVSFVELHRRCHELLARVLVESKLVRCSAEAALDQGITRTFMPHGLGHLLGTLVHDSAGRVCDAKGTALAPPSEHPFLRLTRELEQDMVLTIEPGLYFIDSLLAEMAQSPAAKLVNWSEVEKLLPYGGIRIEDNLRITAQAPENLTRDAFAGLESA
ncbi:Xaa-Pro dipeptidase [Motiliproteus coralliicola]|uniref:Xaa-Pro dipeptidase n=1 Tax=Motiliproteus coralliicola TaxID=2283196 RepID=A0A369WEE3_9GAMM|nr:Xaa-Pro dipeptidase [Motiliproteus coralliicola]RDE19663.1 Xaa-Pro dipeptidase [Motiliproteus coralliicola]